LNEKARLPDWNCVIIQSLVAVFQGLMAFLPCDGRLKRDRLFNYFVPALLAAVVLVRGTVRWLPGFLTTIEADIN
jgi:hypothetical protein